MRKSTHNTQKLKSVIQLSLLIIFCGWGWRDKPFVFGIYKSLKTLLPFNILNSTKYCIIIYFLFTNIDNMYI